MRQVLVLFFVCPAACMLGQCVPRGCAFVSSVKAFWGTYSSSSTNARIHFAISRRMSMNSNGDNQNSTDILRSVGATGNLRFKSTKTNPVDSKREEPNFKVKARDENIANKSASGTAVSEYARSLSSQGGPSQARFENLVDFPCKFQIKVVGSRQGEFVEDILDSIGLVVNRPRSDLKHSFRDNGKWRSITVEVPVQSADQLYDVYAAIDRDPRVKFKF